jgi:hypothetical protein
VATGLPFSAEAIAAQEDEVHVARHDTEWAIVNAAWMKQRRLATAYGAKPSRKTRVKTQAAAIGGAVALGAALAAMDASGDVMLKLAHKLTPQIPSLSILLADPQGRELVKVVMALLVHTACTQTDLVPKKELVARVAELQVTMATMKLLAPHLEVLGEMALDLVKVGEKLPEELPTLGGLLSSPRVTAADAEVVPNSRERAS